RLGEGLLRADRDPQPGLAEAAHPGQPDVEPGLELVERGGRAAGVLPGLIRCRWRGEVRRVARGEHADDDVAESPGDRGEGRGDRWGEGVVDREVAGTDLHGRCRAAARAHAPGVRHRRPEVLVVGEAVEAGSQLMVPVELPLLAQRLVPVECVCIHAPTLTPLADRIGPLSLAGWVTWAWPAVTSGGRRSGCSPCS